MKELVPLLANVNVTVKSYELNVHLSVSQLAREQGTVQNCLAKALPNFCH